MTRKMFTWLIIASCLSLIFLPGTLYAKPNTPVTIYEKKEIKDNRELLERAKNGVTDLVRKENPSAGILVNTEKMREAKLKTYETTQHLKTSKSIDGILEKEYVTTVITIIPEEAFTTLATYKDFTQDGFISDSSGWITVYSKSYFTIYEVSIIEKYIRNYRSSGYWIIDNPNYTLSNKKVTMGSWGVGQDGTPVNWTKEEYPSGLSFDYYPVPGMPYVVLQTEPHLHGCGTSIYARVSNGSSSWDFYVINFAMGPSDIPKHEWVRFS